LRRLAIEPHLVSPSTGLQFKNLSPEEREKAELRLAEISIENAKNQEKLALATINLTSSLEKLSSTFAGFDTAIAAIFARHAAINPNASPLPGGSSNPFSSIFSGGNLINQVNSTSQKMASGGMTAPQTQQSSGGKTINLGVTIVAQDVNSFKGSERDTIRTMSRAIRSGGRLKARSGGSNSVDNVTQPLQARSNSDHALGHGYRRGIDRSNLPGCHNHSYWLPRAPVRPPGGAGRRIVVDGRNSFAKR
jgi:hypothetical protein